MTKKEALEICVKIWEYLEKHPNDYKSYAINQLNLPNMINNCPLCEYVKNNFEGLRCSECPVKWPYKKEAIQINNIHFSSIYIHQKPPCEKSYFTIWKFNKAKASEMAKEMKELAQKTLKEMEKKND